MKHAEAGKRAAKATARNSRRRSREFAVQGLYQWQLAGADAGIISAELAEAEGFGRCDADYFRALLNGTIREAAGLQGQLEPLIERKWDELSPIERGILLLAAWELTHQIEIPYRVVINEAVDLAKVYGGTDGHKFVNGVIDRLAQQVRQLETAGSRTAG